MPGQPRALTRIHLFLSFICAKSPRERTIRLCAGPLSTEMTATGRKADIPLDCDSTPSIGVNATDAAIVGACPGSP